MKIVTMCTAHGVVLEGQPMLTQLGEKDDKSAYSVDLSEMHCPTAVENDLFWCNITWVVCVVS